MDKLKNKDEVKTSLWKNIWDNVVGKVKESQGWVYIELVSLVFKDLVCYYIKPLSLFGCYLIGTGVFGFIYSTDGPSF